MARLTVEDCLPHVENRFDLVLKAAVRAREIEKGAEPLVPWDKDKATVLALREIASGLHDTKAIDILEETPAPVEAKDDEKATEIDAFIAEEMQVIPDAASPESTESDEGL